METQTRVTLNVPYISSFSSCFLFCFFFNICGNSWKSLGVLKETNRREGWLPLASVLKEILKNPGIRSSLVHSTGKNLNWKLCLQVVAPRPAVQTISFFSNIFTTVIFSGRVWDFILTTLTSVLKTVLRCFWHCVQSNKQLATYFLGVLSLALVLLRVVSGCSAHTSWPGWTPASVSSTPLWLPLCTTTQNIGLVPVASSPCLLVFMESWMPVCTLRL